MTYNQQILTVQSGPITEELGDLSGGQNDSSHPSRIALNECPAIDNFVPSKLEGRSLTKRKGLTSVFTTAAKSIGFFEGNNGNYHFDATLIENLSGTNLHTGLTSSSQAFAATLGTYDVMVNGTENRGTTDGTTWAAIAAMTTAGAFKYIVEYNGIMYGWGHDTDKLRWCDTGDVTTWPAAQEADFAANDTARGLCSFSDTLMAFTDRGFYRLVHYDDNLLPQVVDRHDVFGCESGKSIVCGENVVAWWSSVGPVIYDGARVHPVGQDKVPAWLDARDESKDSNCHGVYNPLERRFEWWVDYDDQDNNWRKLLYYPTTGAFFPCSGAGAKMSASGLIRASGAYRIYVGNDAAGKVFYENKADDDGTSITATLTTRRYGKRTQRRDFGSVQIVTEDASGASYSIELLRDGSTSDLGAWTFAPGTNQESAGPEGSNIGENGETYQVKITESSSDVNGSITSILVRSVLTST